MANVVPSDPVGPIRRGDALGWASVALGAPMIAAPRRLLRAIGVRPEPRPVAITMAVGARELLAAVTILGMRHRRVGAWSRVGGDTIDFGLLGAALRNRRASATRLSAAAAAVVLIFGLDLRTARQLSEAEGADLEDGSSSHGVGTGEAADDGPFRLRTAVTIRRPIDEVRRAFREFDWSSFDPVALEGVGGARLVPAPGDRGTEVHVDQDFAGRSGGVGYVGRAPLGLRALKLAGRAPDQKVNDELRRFKAILEAAVDPRSEKTPEGPSAMRQILQRPAQPVGAG